MSLRGVLRPGHVCIRVLDMDASLHHYRDVLGLIETDRDDQGRVYLKGWDEHDHSSVILRQADKAGMDFMGFKVDSKESLERLEKRLQEYGLTTERIPAGELKATGERVRFVIPTGHQIELFAEKEIVGNGMPYVNPDAWPDGIVGMRATRFDHCLLYGPDIEGSVKVFTDVLDFDITEQVTVNDEKIGLFVTCSNKAHDLAFIKHPDPDKLHHVSFYLETWEDVLRAADIISKEDISLDIGPTRHGITRGATIYFFDPSGNRNEVFSGGYIWYPDKPVLTWNQDQLGKAIFYHDRKLNDRFLTVVT